MAQNFPKAILPGPQSVLSLWMRFSQSIHTPPVATPDICNKQYQATTSPLRQPDTTGSSVNKGSVLPSAVSRLTDWRTTTTLRKPTDP